MPNHTIVTERLNGRHKRMHIRTNNDEGGAYILISDRMTDENVGFVLTANERWELIEFLSRES